MHTYVDMGYARRFRRSDVLWTPILIVRESGSEAWKVPRFFVSPRDMTVVHGRLRLSSAGKNGFKHARQQSLALTDRAVISSHVMHTPPCEGKTCMSSSLRTAFAHRMKTTEISSRDSYKHPKL